MADAIGQVISLWPGGRRRPRSARKRIFVCKLDRETGEDPARPCTHGVRFNEKIAVESYTVKTGAVVRHSQTKRERGRGLPNCALLRSVGSRSLTFAFCFFAPLQALHGFGVTARAGHEGKQAFSDLHGFER
jgi:hypothetical protein